MVAIARVANCVGRLLFDTKFQGALSNSIKASGRAAKIAGKSRFSNFGKQVGDAFVRAERKTSKNSFYKDIKELVTKYPSDVSNAWKNANGFTEKAKALWNVTKSRGPLLGYGLLVGFELPNIIKATWEDGAITGAVEAGKSTARLAGGSLGAAIGTAVFPGLGTLIGSIVGWTAGEMITSKIVGKSYTEKKLAQEQELMQKFQQNNQIQTINNAQMMGEMLTAGGFGTNVAGSGIPNMPTLNQEQLLQLQNALYGNRKIDLQG